MGAAVILFFLAMGTLAACGLAFAYGQAVVVRAGVNLVLAVALLVPTVWAFARVIHPEHAWTTPEAAGVCQAASDGPLEVRAVPGGPGRFRARVERPDGPIASFGVRRPPTVSEGYRRTQSALPAVTSAGDDGAFVLLRFTRWDWWDEVELTDGQFLVYVARGAPPQTIDLGHEPAFPTLGVSPHGPCLRSADGRRILRFDIGPDGALRLVAWPLDVRSRGLVWPAYWAVWLLLMLLATGALCRDLITRWRQLSRAQAGLIELTDSGPEWHDGDDVWRITNPPRSLVAGPALALDARPVDPPDGPYRGALAGHVRLGELISGDPETLRLDAGLRVADRALGLLVIGLVLAWFFATTITV